MKYQKSRSALFLMELMIAIFFFAITSAVCVRVFVSAHLLDRQTTALNHAVAQAESMAEVFKASNGDMDRIRELYPDMELLNSTKVTDGTPETDETGESGETGETEGTVGEIYYDKNWQTTAASDTYHLTLTVLPEEDGCARAQIQVFSETQTDPIYTLEVKKFVKGTLP